MSRHSQMAQQTLFSSVVSCVGNNVDSTVDGGCSVYERYVMFTCGRSGFVITLHNSQ